ncbi:MAG: hypothetical protein K940chlam5_00154 [Candidatus Anoxychlamydiales bacterium]|nr:hypothetical protein [Candidatus Anoxychlamydiales bacterium]
MSSEFKVCSYNLGKSNGSDYRKLLKYNDSPLAEDKTDAFNDKYKKIEEKVAQFLSLKADVFFLQEIGDENRALIAELKFQNFSIIHFNWKKDSSFCNAIALSNYIFIEIVNHSMAKEFGKDNFSDIAIATAKDSWTGQKILFVSALGLEDLSKKEPISDELSSRDLYWTVITAQTSPYSDCAIKLISADMRVPFEVAKKLFTPFQKEGFEILKTNLATTLNSLDVDGKKDEIIPFETPETETAFIFAKTKPSYLTAASSLVFKTEQNSATILDKKRKPVTFDPETNASNHIAIFAKVTTKKVDSYASSASTLVTQYLQNALKKR